MKLLVIALLWVAVVALFSLGGYYGADRTYNRNRGGGYDVQCAVEAGSLGVGLATCAALGVLILMGVHSRQIGRGTAVLLSAVSCAGSALLTPASLTFGIAAFSVGYRGKEGFGPVALFFFMGFAAVIAFFILLALVAGPEDSGAPSHGPTNGSSQ